MTEHKRRLEAVTQIQQTQPELGDSHTWYEAAGGLKKGGYVFGFGSDTQHYFPEVVRQKNLKSGQSSTHAACEEQIKELKEENKQLKDKLEWLESQIAAITGANSQCLQSNSPNLHRAGSHESSGVMLCKQNRSEILTLFVMLLVSINVGSILICIVAFRIEN